LHELAIARAIVATAERHAGGHPVAVVRVEVGRLRQVVPEFLAFSFQVASRGTGCEGAELECEAAPSLLRCRACGAEWDPAPPPAREDDQLVLRFRCPGCNGAEHRVVSGEQLLVESIDVAEMESC
jgi:hydrogenase nickel incorporation protein HypA/HybF